MVNMMIKLHRHTTYVQVERVRRFPPSKLPLCVRQRLQNQSVTLEAGFKFGLEDEIKNQK